MPLDNTELAFSIQQRLAEVSTAAARKPLRMKDHPKLIDMVQRNRDDAITLWQRIPERQVDMRSWRHKTARRLLGIEFGCRTSACAIGWLVEKKMGWRFGITDTGHRGPMWGPIMGVGQQRPYHHAAACFGLSLDRSIAMFSPDNVFYGVTDGADVTLRMVCLKMIESPICLDTLFSYGLAATAE